MRRGLLSFALAALLCASPALVAQRGAGIELHGVPASVTSQRADGRLGGVAASVTDPGFGVRQGFRLGSGHHHHGGDRDVRPVYASPAYGYYVGFNDYPGGYYDDSQQQAQDQPQTVAQQDPAQPDDSSRYGQHYFDGRDSKRQYDSDQDQLEPSRPAPAPAAPAADDTPSTTLVYRDGHKSEVRNYAIVGSNLIDLTKSPVLKKIPLDSLDLVATRKENEENGVDFHAP